MITSSISTALSFKIIFLVIGSFFTKLSLNDKVSYPNADIIME